MRRALDPHHRRRFPAEIISRVGWLYHAFSLSLRDVELLLAERGVTVSYEAGSAMVRQAQRFLSAHGPNRQHFHPCRHRLSAANYRQTSRRAFEAWAEITCPQNAA